MRVEFGFAFRDLSVVAKLHTCDFLLDLHLVDLLWYGFRVSGFGFRVSGLGSMEVRKGETDDRTTTIKGL